MTKDGWLELTVGEKKKYNYLVELQDLTKQLAESLDRNDQVSAKMLLAMREDPLRQLTELNRMGKVRLAALPEEDRRRTEELRSGQLPREDGERLFQEQAGKTRRLLEQVVEADRRINLRMAGEHSFYSK